MSERGKPVISAETRTNQARAADPNLSIWVSANAGSGKTFVLTRRVLRLLLAGATPQSILCLTYTKAAAAEMRGRIAKELARWAILPEPDLVRELKDIEGSAYRPALIERARTLFAQALETPGGLKIVTIHAFCESVLHRFPLEAGVPFDFKVIEDEERIQLLTQTREAVLAQGLRGEGATAAVETLFGLLSDFALGDAIELALTDGRKLKAVLADIPRAKANLGRLVGHDGVGSAQLQHRLTSESLLTPEGIREIVRLFGGDPSGNNRFVDLLARLDPAALDGGQLRTAFLTDKGTARKLLTAKQQADRPDILARLEAEQDRVSKLVDALSTALLVERSEALLDVVALIASRYQAHKRARSLLDFDDLVEKLGDLLENPDAGPWVQYKLDTGIDHILVDESQDTNPEQWRVVRAIADEFFNGAGDVTRLRSLFAVGDQKQSIYSFQGAEPTLFGETGDLFRRRAAEVEVPFLPLRLHMSFRTLPEVLRAVDKVSDDPNIQNALLESDKVHHDTSRPTNGGSVWLWPPLQQGTATGDAREWPVEPAEGGEKTAPRQVAERIAREIKGWIDSKRPLTNRGRPVRPNDVLILVQSRGAMFQEVIRALRQAGLPTPGADRLAVSDHIAVLDLLALCDVLLNPADNLQLAALLRSPLFDIDEDELFALAQPRDRGRTLWQALEAAVTPGCVEAHRALARWRGELDFERPFEFLTQVLYAEGGLRRFHARLGEEVDEVFAELLELALAHEQGPQPSLQGFVVAMRQSAVSIKRELAEAGNGVRVMTVHGAKGLEAPIVILADAASKPQGNQVNRPVYLLTEAPGPLLVHASGSKSHVPGSLSVKSQVETNLAKEYWRRLYVAMTRAEDELYVTGALTPAAKAERQLEGTWYQAIERALRAEAEIVHDAEGQETALIYPRERVAPQPVKSLTSPVPAASLPQAFAAVPAPRPVPLVSPSSARGHVRPVAALDSLAQQARDAEAARREGIALHALLQHLGRVDRALWPAIVPKALMALLPEAAGQHERIGAKAMSILTRPELAGIFAPNSRAEVPFLVEACRDGAPIRLAGRIDRLVIDDSRLMVIDYKSDMSVPGGPGDVPGPYLTQLGLYALVASQLFPDRSVEAAILWTGLESLMILPSDLLVEAAKGFTLR
ncbi:double-strand break repair helicase AddA [Devosia yakushimensis]|uniref:DNA 3'-5' helicase n=1 Tax=Devosia yakushimensis TaxID=470028 RepID=A0ABQ5UJY4_9HYPH|nr:double-strand break repair helicase AddA [Devosia yakushimensis]GLQ12362.1 double-strand break repair helicase AddA [Devosia yakushimensis]